MTLAEQVVDGDRRALARAITLVESTRDDHNADAAALLDALNIRAAHIVGASMGGFIAQLVAINHPDRVLSLTSIMSGPGGEDAVAPKPEGAAVLVASPPATREERVEQAMGFRPLDADGGCR